MRLRWVYYSEDNRTTFSNDKNVARSFSNSWASGLQGYASFNVTLLGHSLFTGYDMNWKHADGSRALCAARTSWWRRKSCAPVARMTSLWRYFAPRQASTSPCDFMILATWTSPPTVAASTPVRLKTLPQSVCCTIHIWKQSVNQSISQSVSQSVSLFDVYMRDSMRVVIDVLFSDRIIFTITYFSAVHTTYRSTRSLNCFISVV